MATKRIYLVSPSDLNTGLRLVRATTRQQALSHVANSMFVVSVATQDDLVELLPETKVESAVEAVTDSE